MGKLTEKGYKIKTQNEIFEEEKSLYLEIDPLWNLDPSTPDGLKIAHDSEVFSSLDEQVKQAYDARDPNKASGYDLDILGAITGAVRSQGTPSTVNLKITGVPGTIIRADSKVKTTDNIIFLTDETVTIGLDGTITVGAHCEKNGAIAVDADSLTNIVETVGGWQSVTNPLPAVAGTDRDSDTVFRVKRAKAVGRAGQNQKESLYGELYDTEGVRKVAVYENKTNSQDVDPTHNPRGLPPHSLAIVVDGGSDQDVAESIYRKLCPGVALHAVGTKVEKTVYSKIFPASYDVITFSRPNYVDISLEITVKDASGSLPTDDDLQTEIRNAYIDYYEGDLIPSGIGFMNSGFDIGDSVPYSRMFTPANKVVGEYEGAYVSDLKLNGGTSLIKIEFNQLARFRAENITVKVE